MTDLLTKEDPNRPIDDDRNRAIHVAAATGNTEGVVKELLRGAKVDAENYLGWTPLMMAARNGHMNTAGVLLQYKADVTRKNKFGMSVFHVSIANGSEELILLILDSLLRGGVSRQSIESVLSPLSLAILFNRSSILTLLINKSFNVNASTLQTAITPLMFAAALDNMSAYQLLLSANANPSSKNVNQHSAQDIVCYNRHPKDHNQKLPSTPVTPVNPIPPLLAVPLPRSRVSSGLMSPTPGWFFSPHVSPVSPFPYHQHHQVFFPPDFSPGTPVAVFSPHEMHHYQGHHAQTPGFLSPFVQHPFYSPFLNERMNGYMSPV